MHGSVAVTPVPCGGGIAEFIVISAGSLRTTSNRVLSQDSIGEEGGFRRSFRRRWAGGNSRDRSAHSAPLGMQAKPGTTRTCHRPHLVRPGRTGHRFRRRQVPRRWRVSRWRRRLPTRSCDHCQQRASRLLRSPRRADSRSAPSGSRSRSCSHRRRWHHTAPGRRTDWRGRLPPWRARSEGPPRTEVGSSPSGKVRPAGEGARTSPPCRRFSWVRT